VIVDLLEGLVEEEVTADGTILDFVITKTDLSKALGRVQSVVSNKDIFPLLKNVCIRVGSDLSITGSDAILSAVTRAPVVSVYTEGEALLPGARLAAVLREAGPDNLRVGVEVKKEKFTARVRSDKTVWTFPLMSAAGFPNFWEAESVGLQEVPRVDFLSALLKVRKSISTDSIKSYLQMVDIKNDLLRSSDGIRFQQVKFPFPFECSIPARAVHEVIQRMQADDAEFIEVGQTTKALLYRIGNALLIAQKTSAQFPPVDEVLLKPSMANDQILTVNRQALLNAVKRVRVTADEDSAAVVLSLNAGSVSAECKDRKGAASVETVAAEWDRAPRHVSFNHRHLVDLLSSTDADTVRLRLGKDLKTKPTPLVMEDEGSGFTAALSPLRLDWL
jgi:DNA polymerase-3 subunit beta